MQLTLGEVATLLGSTCGAPERKAEGYSTDSRTLAPGQLFFPLRGPRFDGHQFVGAALERGAAGAVVEEAFFAQAPPASCPLLLPVADTLQALQRLAVAVRRRWGRRVIAVTGSAGKSTTKEMIATLLARRLKVHKSSGNLNNHIGVPLALLALEPEHDIAVLELAMSAAGEIRRLAEIAQPEMGVVTNVAPVHLEFFDSVEAIARAKKELIDYLAARKSGVTVVLNFDDERVRSFADGFPGRVVTFGLQVGAEFRGTIGPNSQATEVAFRVEGPHLDGEFTLPLPGRHDVQNALAAIATASLFDVDVADLQKGLANFQNLQQRSEILTLPGGATVINDCYNSNPLAMKSMLETLAAWPHARRRMVVVGEMLELGPTSPDLHREIGGRCAESGVSWLLAVQGNARFFLEGALERGFRPEHARFFATAKEAGEFCRGLLEPGDVVLVKGSRGVHLETAIELLRSSSIAPEKRSGPKA